MPASDIPIIDFATCGLENEDCTHEELSTLGKSLVQAFSDVGFVYLRNCGIDDDFVQKANRITGQFFASPVCEKERYNKKPGKNFGYMGIETERPNPKLPSDYKELFNAGGEAFYRTKQEWPDDIAPGFSEVMLDFMKRSKELSLRILHALAIGMDLKDEKFFHKCHSDMNTMETFTTGRSLYYPPITKKLKPDQQRFTEHSDYTSISLVFQDSVGGLQVQRVDGEYVDATPVVGTVLVNIGNTMQFWTKGKLKSTKHRVVVPDNEHQLKTVRRSLAYFVHPNNDAYINQPLMYKDESLNAAETVSQEDLITSKEYLLDTMRAVWEDRA